MQLNIAKQRWTLQDTQNVPAAAAAAAAGAGRGGAEKVKEAAGAAWRTERGSDERARMDVTAATAGAGHDSNGSDAGGGSRGRTVVFAVAVLTGATRSPFLGGLLLTRHFL